MPPPSFSQILQVVVGCLSNTRGLSPHFCKDRILHSDKGTFQSRIARHLSSVYFFNRCNRTAIFGFHSTFESFFRGSVSIATATPPSLMENTAGQMPLQSPHPMHPSFTKYFLPLFSSHSALSDFVIDCLYDLGRLNAVYGAGVLQRLRLRCGTSETMHAGSK